jgi:SAM-dependent MidA family methyltransferase
VTKGWEEAWQEALYGPDGFYLRPEGPAGHFRTASHAAPEALGEAVARLASSIGARSIVDVGTGRGELLTALLPHAGQHLWGVDVVGRPTGLAAGIHWAEGLESLPDLAFDDALVIAWELLDVVPMNILEIDEHGLPVTVLVDPRTGREHLGGPPASIDRDWIESFWPPGDLEEGDRIEVGRTRDRFWEALVARAPNAVAALCVDYAHTRETRPGQGSLSGFRAGREVPPRPDGTMDITAHVAIDSVATVGGRTVELTTQARALAGLGITEPELLDEGGLGGFAWLLQEL